MVFLSSPLTYTKMNTLFLLKHTSSKRVTFNAISCFLSSDKFIPKNTLQFSKIHNFATAANTLPRNCCWVNGKIGTNSVKGFHVGRSLQAATASALVDLEEDCDDGLGLGLGPELGLEISKLGISEEIVSALAQRGITSLFPIQKAVLEPAMQGSDMIGRARTGTGKTLAFGIPIMDKIIHFNKKNGKGRNPLALIMAPTRELARQVEKEFYESAPGLDTLCVYGGVPISRQISTLQRGADIVVGTPGRIIDLLKRRSLNLSDIQFVVLDEADQMLNVGFAEDVETILENVRQIHQTMMFSATMPSWILKLTKKFLKKPINIDLVGDSDQKLADGISLYSIACEMRQKPAVLGPLISEHAKGGKCIVFTQTKRDADRLASVMQKTLRCEALHGDITQSQRERTLSGFRQGQFSVLVATDVAARGLDVPNVDLVIHYELPNSSEIFVHRSGRTGRAGKKGSAIVIHSLNQHRSVRGIESDVGCRFTELPRINVEAGAVDLYSDMGKSGDRFGSYGGTGRGRSGDFGGGRSGGYGNSGSRFGEGGSSSVRRGGFSGSGSGRSGGGSSGPSSGRSSKFGGSGVSKRLGGFRNFGSGRSSRFGDSRSDRDSRSSRFDGYGDGKDSSHQSSGRNFSNPIPRRRAEWEFTFNR